MNKTFWSTLLLIFVFGISGAAYAEDAVTEIAKEGLKGAFKEAERQLIKEYFGEYGYVSHSDDSSYSGKGKKWKKGKKGKGMPPGIAMNLERGKPLPPGIAKKQLPSGLHSKLPKVPDGYERTIVGNDVLLVEIDTGRIADIMVDAVLGD